MHITDTTGFANRKLIELSDGESQKVMLARALAQDTPVIILDEPTAHLDLPNRITLMHLLHQLAKTTGKGILLSTHDLDLALQTADEVWLLRNDGDFTKGAPEDIVLNGTFEAAFHKEGFAFDKNSGTFTIHKSNGKTIRVEGEGAPLFWTKRALLREGFRFRPMQQQYIQILDKDNTVLWTYQPGNVCHHSQSVAGTAITAIHRHITSVRQQTDKAKTMKPILLISATLAAATTMAQSVQTDTLKTQTLGQVVITATRSEVQRNKIPQSMTVINKKDLEKTGGQDFVDLLKKNASVNVVQYPGLLAGIGIRGFRPQTGGLNQRVLLLIDGRPAGAANIATINPSDIERIEVLKGPASALYGAQAMGGVVNVITRNRPALSVPRLPQNTDLMKPSKVPFPPVATSRKTSISICPLSLMTGAKI